MTKVLVIDDERQIRRLLRVSLEKQAFEVHEAANGEEGLRLIRGRKPDVVLLDLGLPDTDGETVLSGLRAWSTVPVVVISVRNAEDDIVRLLDAGADDYVVKPFNTAELIARIKVSMRHRAPQQTQEVFVSGRLSVDLLNREVRAGGDVVRLTPTEYAMLRLLVQHAGRILTHGQMLREIWGPSAEGERNYLRVYMTGLRKKIEATPQMPELIVTEPAVGYRLKLLPPQDAATP
jgi:two-component system, OmpR family, KDP operon response regulator KdpE